MGALIVIMILAMILAGPIGLPVLLIFFILWALAGD